MSNLYAGGTALMVLLSGTAALAVPSPFITHSANAGEVAAAMAGQGSLNHAISAIEDVTGGHVIAIRFETANGVGNYSATVARNGNVDRAIVNLATKKVAVLDQGQGPARTFDFKEKTDAEVIVNSTVVALRDAVAKAEHANGGVAVSAEIKRTNGNITVEGVRTVHGNFTNLTLVDAKNGLIVENPQALIDVNPLQRF